MSTESPRPRLRAGLSADAIAGLLFFTHWLSFPRCLYLALPGGLLGLAVLYEGWWTALPAHLPGDGAFNASRALLATLRSLSGGVPASELSAPSRAVDLGGLIVLIALLLTIFGVALRLGAAAIHLGALRLAGQLRLVLVDVPTLAPAPTPEGGLTTLLLYPAPAFQGTRLTADARSTRALRSIAARARHLREIHALSADTPRNLTLAQTLLAARSRAGCTDKLDQLSIRIDSRALRSSLGREAFAQFSNTVNDARLISMPEMRSRHLLRLQPPSKMRVIGIKARPVLVIIGLGDAGLELLVHLCAHAQSPHLERLAVVLVDVDATAKVHEVLELWPALALVVSLLPMPFEPHLPQSASTLLLRLESEGLLATCLYVTLDDDALASAWEQEVELAVRSGARVPPLVLRLNALRESDALLLQDEESIARLQQAVHRSYLGGATRHTDVDWSRLPFDYREDNRSEVDHYWTKANDLGWTITAGGAPADLAVAPEQLDAMAAAEHRRWIASRAVAGWRCGGEPSDLARTHPSLVAWSELSDAERSKDQALVQRMSVTLQAAKFGLRALRSFALPRSPDREHLERGFAQAGGSGPFSLPHCVVAVDDARSFELASGLIERTDVAFSIVVTQPLAGLATRAGMDALRAQRLMESACCVWLTTPALVPQVLARWPDVS